MDSPDQNGKRNGIIMAIFAAVLITVSVLFALTERARSSALQNDLKKMTEIMNLQRQEAEKQKKLAEEQISILDLRIYELEIKYDMCMTKK